MTPILLPLLERSARRAMARSGVTASRIATELGDLQLYDAPGSGDLPTIVLLHGLTASAVQYTPLIARLRRRARRVVALDLPGHGLSETPASMTAERLFAATSAALLQIATEPVVLVGNSLGGAVAVHHAIVQPARVAGLVLLSPAGAPSSEAELAELRGAFRIRSRRDAVAFLARVQPRPTMLSRLIAHELPMVAQRPAVRDLLASADRAHDPAIGLATLAMPVLLWWGRSEHLLPPAHLAWWRDQLPAHAVVEEPIGIGHCPQLDDPARLADRISAFFAMRETPTSNELRCGRSAHRENISEV